MTIASVGCAYFYLETIYWSKVVIFTDIKVGRIDIIFYLTLMDTR